MGDTFTGPPRYPGPTTYPGTDQYPGQGDQVEIQVLYSTDDYSNPTPTWQYAHHGIAGASSENTRLRRYSVDRGRETELQEIDAATATLALNNRDRAFDPAFNAEIEPMNRWWVRALWGGETFDRFLGYAERIELSWPEKGKDSVAMIQCADELKILNLQHLPTMSPPRDTYAEIIAYELVDGYWNCDGQAATSKVPGTIGGKDLLVFGPGGSSMNFQEPAPIVGDRGKYLFLGNGARAESDVLQAGEAGSPAACTEIAFGCVFQYDAPPASEQNLITGPVDSGGFLTYSLTMLSTGQIKFYTRNAAGTTVTVTSTGALVANAWYHVVCSITGGNMRLYLNGAQDGSAGFTGPFASDVHATDAILYLGSQGATASDFSFDEVWMKRTGVSATRVAAIYQAGTSRGFAADESNERIGKVLDAVSNHAPRSFLPEARDVAAVFMHGQPALEESRYALSAANVDAMFFGNRSGGLTYLSSGHRSLSPWNTVQMIFDDDGTDSRYLETAMDLSESFLANPVNITREEGLTQTRQDLALLDKYGPRPFSLTVPTITDGDADNIAIALLAKYKLPLNRIPDVTPDMSNANVCSAALARELGDKIRVIRRPLGGGSAIDQSSWIQKIGESGTPGNPLQMKFGVSPV